MDPHLARRPHQCRDGVEIRITCRAFIVGRVRLRPELIAPGGVTASRGGIRKGRATRSLEKRRGARIAAVWWARHERWVCARRRSFLCADVATTLAAAGAQEQ